MLEYNYCKLTYVTWNLCKIVDLQIFCGYNYSKYVLPYYTIKRSAIHALMLRVQLW